MIHVKQDIKEEEKKAFDNYKNIKSQLIKQGKQLEIFRAPNPQASFAYPEEDFTEFIVTQNNQPIKLKTYRYQPTNGKPPKGLFIQFHGMGSHSNHGAHIAKAFADQGFCVMGFDHRGYGKSEGLRGYVESLNIHLQDSKQFIDLIEKIYGKDIPKFVGGLSMGGMTSYRLTLEEPKRYRGAILLAPALKNPNNFFLKGLVNTVSWMMPRWQIIKIVRGLANKNPQIGDDIDKDPFVYLQKQRPQTIKSVFDGMDSDKTFAQYNCPFIFVQGGVDKLVDPDACFELFEKCQTKDKELIFYQNLWHDVWHEQEIKEILPKIIQWANERI